MKKMLNIMLYLTQLLHLKMGGTLEVSRDKVSLIAPDGRYWFATEENVENQLPPQ